ncbi:MAG: hypothetical protein Q9220_001508 [cf. Caloplaca sp. 1 TL-2023]
MDILRPYLLPLTRSLPAPLVRAGTSLLGPTCYKTLIHNLDPFSNPPCLRLLLSKTLSLGILTLSSIVKIPQIINLLHNSTASGVSFLSYLLETLSYGVTLAYSARMGFPFTSWGEMALISVQDLCVGVLCLVYGGYGGGVAAAFVAAMGVGLWVVLDGGLVGMGTLTALQAGAGTVGVLSKGPQIWANWKRGGTGVLSAFTVFTYLAGSLSRIFTTLQEVDDKLILYGFIGGFLLNAVLAAQMVYYWRSPATASHAAELGDKPKQIAMGSSSGASPAKGKGPTTRRRG